MWEQVCAALHERHLNRIPCQMSRSRAPGAMLAVPAMKLSRLRPLAFAILWGMALVTNAGAETITVATGTAIDQSGLLAKLLPQIKQATGVDVKIEPVGTAQALERARSSAADVLFLREQPAEALDGHVLRKAPVMYSDFVLIGPKGDPAKAKGTDIALALKRISATGSAFISRGDQSGTHLAEVRGWDAAGVKDRRSGAYRECKCSTASALNIAGQAYAYTVVDRSAWLVQRDRAELTLLVEGDALLFDQYTAYVVGKPRARRPAHLAASQKFVDWLVSPAGQMAIGSYRVGGQQVYFPNAQK